MEKIRASLPSSEQEEVTIEAIADAVAEVVAEETIAEEAREEAIAEELREQSLENSQEAFMEDEAMAQVRRSHLPFPVIPLLFLPPGLTRSFPFRFRV